MEDGGGRQGTAGDGGKQRKTTENSGRRRKTAGDGGGRRGTAGDGIGRPGTVGNGPSLGCVGQVPEKTGRDDRMPSVLVLDSYLSGNFRK